MNGERSFAATSLPVARRLATAGIIAILMAMLVGPAFSPPEFDWIRHSTSEQAGQHMEGAWIMRTGFAAYGGAVLLASALTLRQHLWPRAALAVFGAGLVATAIWSNAPIIATLPADMHEDWLHSVASGVVGTAFAAACAASLFAPGGTRRDWLAWVGLTIAMVIPLAMNWFPELRGLLQRAMFGYSFLFVLREFGDPAIFDKANS